MARKKTKVRAASVPVDTANSKKTIPKKKAVVIEWEKYMGNGDLEDWRRLMQDLGFEEEFASKNQCRKALKTVWVNIPDFLQAIKNGEPVHHFANQRELAVYTVTYCRFYPRRSIKKGSPLKQLLANILVPNRTQYRGVDELVSRMGGLSFLGYQG
ncbi:hypothetical protein GGS21DRAFT_74652 [Xylaria nigripes]|nr:hypothetical protein GGS21DRAFT_74652 [Xylaria nigripes]